MISILNFIQPLLSIPFIGFFFYIFLFFKYCFISKCVTFGLPTLLSTLCWSVSLKSKTNNSLFIEILNLILKVVLPITCFALFVLHPEGNKAYIYSFYWFIPVFIYFLDKFKIYNAYFLTALATTFVAHAVGSVIWLYTVPMAAFMWISLIPIVALERFIFACGINLLQKLIFESIKDFKLKKYFIKN
ncbi:hypothetical protein K9M16_04190 [Candidatus Babeliales bacterium]|nr:hypothetical protein [Candidatus Babeliales bacterium]